MARARRRQTKTKTRAMSSEKQEKKKEKKGKECKNPRLRKRVPPKIECRIRGSKTNRKKSKSKNERERWGTRSFKVRFFVSLDHPLSPPLLNFLKFLRLSRVSPSLPDPWKTYRLCSSKPGKFQGDSLHTDQRICKSLFFFKFQFSQR